jgi:hypothetical protein
MHAAHALNRHRARRLTLGGCAALALLSGCGLNNARTQAEGLAEQYFTAAAAGNYDAALQLYAPRFFSATPRERMRGILSDLHERCGAPQRHELTHWSAGTSFSDGSASVNLVYDVHYARCRVTETLGMSEPPGGQLKITAHHLQVTAAAPGGTEAQTV